MSLSLEPRQSAVSFTANLIFTEESSLPPDACNESQQSNVHQEIIPHVVQTAIAAIANITHAISRSPIDLTIYFIIASISD